MVWGLGFKGPMHATGQLLIRIPASPSLTWGFPQIRGNLLGLLIIRTTVVFWRLYWGPLVLGNYHISSFLAADAARPACKLRVSPVYLLELSLYES